jgi:hypothetical protein
LIEANHEAAIATILMNNIKANLSNKNYLKKYYEAAVSTSIEELFPNVTIIVQYVRNKLEEKLKGKEVKIHEFKYKLPDEPQKQGKVCRIKILVRPEAPVKSAPKSKAKSDKPAPAQPSNKKQEKVPMQKFVY